MVPAGSTYTETRHMLQAIKSQPEASPDHIFLPLLFRRWWLLASPGGAGDSVWSFSG
jgi:hypothetical protein